MWPIWGYLAVYTIADSGENKCNCVSMLTQKKFSIDIYLLKTFLSFNVDSRKYNQMNICDFNEVTPWFVTTVRLPNFDGAIFARNIWKGIHLTNKIYCCICFEGNYKCAYPYVTFFEVTLYVFKQQLHNQSIENPYKFQLNENTHL